jgi:hypothetical protein
VKRDWGKLIFGQHLRWCGERMSVLSRFSNLGETAIEIIEYEMKLTPIINME